MDILIVEDDPTSRLILDKALGKMGHNTIVCENGLEAWQYYQESPVRLVVTDWMMPEMDGLELCRRIRASNQSSLYTYIVILTALHGRDNLLRGLDAGADDFMTKPVDLDQLAARIKVAERIIGLHQEVRALEGLLPICSYCKKIRDGDSWVGIESYVSTRSDASFSHGVCPSCYQTRLLPEIEGLEGK